MWGGCFLEQFAQPSRKLVLSADRKSTIVTFSQSLFCSACCGWLLASNGIQAADNIIQTTSSRSVAPVAVDQNLSQDAPFLDLKFDRPFVPLVTGNGLDGWIVQEGKSTAWKRESDTIRCVSSAGGWLRTVEEYSDFVLRLEYRLQPGGNTGIGLRAPAEGNPTFTGIEIQLLDDSAAKYADLRADQYTGSVYYQVAATQKAKLHPANEWNRCEVRFIGDELTVKINDEVVNQLRLNKPLQNPDSQGEHHLSQRPPLGHLALQSHSTQVDFRNIEIVDLTTQTSSGLRYVDLIPGLGNPVAADSTVKLHYVGQLATGKRFTDTRDSGVPVQVSLSELVSGLQQGIQGMKTGGRRRLVVPPQLAYGEAGVPNSIPGNATLVFEVEVSEIVE